MFYYDKNKRAPFLELYLLLLLLHLSHHTCPPVSQPCIHDVIRFILDVPRIPFVFLDKYRPTSRIRHVQGHTQILSSPPMGQGRALLHRMNGTLYKPDTPVRTSARWHEHVLLFQQVLGLSETVNVPDRGRDRHSIIAVHCMHGSHKPPLSLSRRQPALATSHLHNATH